MLHSSNADGVSMPKQLARVNMYDDEQVHINMNLLLAYLRQKSSSLAGNS